MTAPSLRDAQVAKLIADNERLREALSAYEQTLLFAVERIKLANTEGNPILSAWLPEALDVIEKGRLITQWPNAILAEEQGE